MNLFYSQYSLPPESIEIRNGKSNFDSELCLHFLLQLAGSSFSGSKCSLGRNNGSGPLCNICTGFQDSSSYSTQCLKDPAGVFRFSFEKFASTGSMNGSNPAIIEVTDLDAQALIHGDPRSLTTPCGLNANTILPLLIVGGHLPMFECRNASEVLYSLYPIYAEYCLNRGLGNY